MRGCPSSCTTASPSSSRRDSFTLADLHVSAWIDYLAFFGIDLGPFKALAAWRARCRERPAYARAMSG